MKKLLLLCALFIFACSNDDSNDNSNQTFLERYDGVVWENPFHIPTPQDINDFTSNQFIIFNNETNFVSIYRPNAYLIDESNCINFMEGTNSFGETLNITVNTFDAFQFTSDLAEENSTATIDIYVVNNTMYWDITYFPSEITEQDYFYLTNEINPCD